MTMTDPIADLLTRLRNGLQAGHPTVDMPASRMKEQICDVLKKEGFIKDYDVKEAEDTKRRVIRVSLKYGPDRKPVMQGLRRVSKPSLRVHKRSSELRPVRSGVGISIVSTSQGLMTGKEARAARTGGEVLCEIW